MAQAGSKDLMKDLKRYKMRSVRRQHPNALAVNPIQVSREVLNYLKPHTSSSKISERSSLLNTNEY